MRFFLHHLLAIGVAGACVNDEDCELLGRCVNGACQCAPGFAGQTCGALDLLPVDNQTLGRVWPPSPPPRDQPNVFAWSFSPVRDPATGSYHAVAEVGCGPRWDSAPGFYLAALTAPGSPGSGWRFDRWLSPWRVNSPHLSLAPDGTYVLHFQTGRVVSPPNTTAGPPCAGTSSSATAGAGAGQQERGTPPLPAAFPLRACGASELPWRDNCLCSTAGGSAGSCSDATGVHVASWKSWPPSLGQVSISPVRITGAGWTPFNGSVPTIGESNPSGTLLRDGRSLLAFRSHLKGGLWPGVKGEHIGFALAPRGAAAAAAAAPLFYPTNVTVSANLSYTMATGNDEDPFVWQQPDGTLHCLYHNGRGSTTNLGLHAFSRDGVTWHKPADAQDAPCSVGRNCTALYTSVLQVGGGGSVTLAGRERPSLLFDPTTGQPTHLFTGAIPHQPFSSQPWYAMVQRIRRY